MHLEQRDRPYCAQPAHLLHLRQHQADRTPSPPAPPPHLLGRGGVVGPIPCGVCQAPGSWIGPNAWGWVQYSAEQCSDGQQRPGHVLLDSGCGVQTEWCPRSTSSTEPTWEFNELEAFTRGCSLGRRNNSRDTRHQADLDSDLRALQFSRRDMPTEHDFRDDMRPHLELPSVGSAGHHARLCRPCAFSATKGCTSGEACKFCHLCEPGEKKRRKKERAAQKALRKRSRFPRQRSGRPELPLQPEGEKHEDVPRDLGDELEEEEALCQYLRWAAPRVEQLRSAVARRHTYQEQDISYGKGGKYFGPPDWQQSH